MKVMRKIFIQAMTLLILFPIIFNGGTDMKAAQGTDLARGKIAYADSWNANNEKPSSAVDGNDDTKWCAVASGIKWLAVDLGSEMTIDTYVVKHAEYGGESKDMNTRDFDLQISTDKKIWTNVDSVRGNSEKITERKIDPVEARYVRLYITCATQGAGVIGISRIFGFEIYNGGYEPESGWSEGYKGKVTDIQIEPSSIEADVNGTVRLSAKVTTSGTNKKVTWVSSDPSVASVTSLGKVSAVSKGETSIAAVAEDGGNIGICILKVIGGQIVLEEISQTLWIIEEDGKLKNEIIMYSNNQGEATNCWIKLTSGSYSEIQNAGSIPAGRVPLSVFVPEVTEQKEYEVSIYDNAECTGKALNSTTVRVRPVKKWKFYITQDLHLDIGFTEHTSSLIQSKYPDFFKSAVDMINNSSDWEEASQFRYPAEQAYLLYGSVLKYPNADFYETIKSKLASGHITYPLSYASSALGGMGSEVMTRYGYFSKRYLNDMTGTAPESLIRISDQPGIPTAAVDAVYESGARYFILRPNTDTTSWDHNAYPRLFYMKGHVPGNKLLFQNQFVYASDELGYRKSKSEVSDGEYVKNKFLIDFTSTVIERYETSQYPYDAVLSNFTEGGDNGLFNSDVAYNVKALNDRKEKTGKNYVYPQFYQGQTEKFFKYIEENFGEEIPEFEGGFEDYWVHGAGSASYESGIAKKNHEKLPFAENLSALGTVLFGEEYPYEDIRDSYDLLQLWHEHTWGAGPGGATVNDLWGYKRANILTADRLIDNLMNKSVEAVNKNIPTDGKTLVVYNNLTWERADVVSVDYGEFPNMFEIYDNDLEKSVPYHVEEDGKVVFTAESVPGNGYKTYKIKEVSQKPSFDTTVVIKDNVIENNFFKVVLENDGSISSVIDKQNGNKELVDKEAPYGFNQFIYLNTNTKWPDKFTPIGSIKEVNRATIKSETGVTSSSLIAEGISGAEEGIDSLTRKITLYDDIAKIDISNTVIKKEAPDTANMDEEGFFVFPFLMDSFEINHETPSGTVSPQKVSSNINKEDNELLYGSATDFFNPNRWIDIGNGTDYGVVLSLKDSILVQYGERSSYKFQKAHRIRDPYVYSWIYNNKWWTNYQKTQPGPVTFEYSIQTRNGSNVTEGRSDIKGQETASPLIGSIIRDSQAGTLDGNKMKFVSISKDNVALTASKDSEMNSEGLIFRFNETGGMDTDVEVDLSLYNIKSVTETDMVENNLEVSKNNVVFKDGKVSFSIPAYGWVTMRAIPDKTAPGQVKNVSAKTDSAGTLVSWDDTEGAYYEIYRSDKSDFIPGEGTYLKSVNEAKYYDHQVTSSTNEYYYSIIAVKNTFKSPHSDIVKIAETDFSNKVLPSSPTNLKADLVYNTRVSLTWSAAKDDIAIKEYAVYKNDRLYAKVAPEHTNYLDYQISGQNISYYVTAVDRDNNESVIYDRVYIDLNTGEGITPEYGEVKVYHKDLKTGEQIAESTAYITLTGTNYSSKLKELDIKEKKISGYKFKTVIEPENSELCSYNKSITYLYEHTGDGGKKPSLLTLCLMIGALAVIGVGIGFGIYFKKKKN